MDKNKVKNQQQTRRHNRVRAKISGTAIKPRLSVFRSNKGMFLQLIDDENGRTLVSVGVKEIKKGAGKAEAAKVKGGKMELGKELGKLLATKAKDKKIGQAVFDRRSYKYHGRVKAVAEGAREGGLEF